MSADTLARVIAIETELARVAALRDLAWEAMSPSERSVLWVPGHGGPQAIGLDVDDILRWCRSEVAACVNLPPAAARWARLDRVSRQLDAKRSRLLGKLGFEQHIELEERRVAARTTAGGPR